MIRQFARSVRVAGHILAGLVIAMLWLAPLAALQRTGSRYHRARIVRSWMRRLLAMLSARVLLHGQPVPGPALLVANHVSWLDIPCVLGSVEAIFVAKDDVARWPVIGRLASTAGTIFLQRGFGTTEALARMVAALRDGERVMIFPEGTSTDGTIVRTFHARLYQAAIETGAPVQAAFEASLLKTGCTPQKAADLAAVLMLLLEGLRVSSRRALPTEVQRNQIDTAFRIVDAAL